MLLNRTVLEKRKKTSEGGYKSRREEKEDQELEETHEDFSELQYRRFMVIIRVKSLLKLHWFHGSPRKSPKAICLMNTCTATAVMKAVTNNHSNQDGVVRSTCTDPTYWHCSGCFSRKSGWYSWEIFWPLYVDGVLSQEEFDEQKEIILSGLKKLK